MALVASLLGLLLVAQVSAALLVALGALVARSLR